MEAKQILVKPIPDGSEQDFNLPYDALRCETEELCDERILEPRHSPCRRTPVAVLKAYRRSLRSHCSAVST